MTDAELVARTLAGDTAGYAGLVGRHRGALQGMAYHWTGDFEAAQDIGQEAFVQAYLHLGELRDPERFGPWLRQLGANLCRRWLSQRRRHGRIDGAAAPLPSPEPPPSDAVERAEVRHQVRAALRRLTPASRLVVTLHYLGGLSYPEVAGILGINANAVAARLHRARRQLKEHLMETVEDGLRRERLGDDFARQVLAQARERALQTRSQWRREEFVTAVSTALRAARDLADAPAQVEMLALLGEAGSTWMNDPAAGVQAYAEALEVAQAAHDRAEAARLLHALCAAHLRHGQWSDLGRRAGEAMALCQGSADRAGQARARAAIDLALRLPGAWAPDQPGGYALAAFPVQVEPDGHRFGDLSAVRHYSWGCPSRCAALVHLYRPRRFLGPALTLGARWDDPVPHDASNMGWRTDSDLPVPVARSEVVAVGGTVATSAATFHACVEVVTVIEPPGGRAPDHTLRSLCGTRRAWFAPGVGLVRLWHHDQNGTDWMLWLLESSAPHGDGFFPLDVGRTWRYRWTEYTYNQAVFEDLCRVEASNDGTAWLSSATWGTEQPLDAIMAMLEEQRAAAEGAGDPVGEELVLRQMEARADQDAAPPGEGRPAEPGEPRTGGPGGLGPAAARARRGRTVAVCEDLLERARAAGDLPGQLRALEAIASHDRTPAREQAVSGQILRLLEEAGDEQGRLEVQHNLERHARQLAPAEEHGWLERRLALARTGPPPLGRSRGDAERQLLEALVRHHERLSEHEQAALRLDELAALARGAEDVEGTAHETARAMLHRALACEPEGPACAYVAGTATMRERDGRISAVGSGRWAHSDPFPAGVTGTTDLLSLSPFFGSELLGGPPGASDTDWLNYGLSGGLSESLRVTSTLADLEQAVEVPAGRLAGCARIESTLAVSAEPRPMATAELSRARGWLAGTREAWFAPGTGLAKLRYAHQNGQVTQVELIEVQLASPHGGWLGLALGNRWRYRWTDTANGVLYDDTLQVATRRGSLWSLCFVTRARPADGHTRPAV